MPNSQQATISLSEEARELIAIYLYKLEEAGLKSNRSAVIDRTINRHLQEDIAVIDQILHSS